MTSDAPPTLDLSDANRIAIGSQQKIWLGDLVSPTGFRPNDYASGKWGASTYRRVESLCASLSRTGYLINSEPLGSRGGHRLVIKNHADGHTALMNALNRSKLLPVQRTIEGYSEFIAAIRRWVDMVGATCCLLAERLAQGWQGSLAQLLEVAELIAQTDPQPSAHDGPKLTTTAPSLAPLPTTNSSHPEA